MTIKHKNTENQCFSIQKSPKIPTFECLCGKKYKDYSGLWRHKKKCSLENNEKTDNTENVNKNEIDKKDDLINYLIKENQEFKSLILEIVKKDNTINNNTISNSNINSHNKTFNLQFFLNETCKNAMNITDFVNSM